MEDKDVLNVNDLDLLIKEKLIPFRERIIDSLAKKHPHIFSMIDAFISGKKNQVGLQVVEDGETVREYTFYLEGIRISKVEPGALSSEIHHPLLGVVKPYGVIERTVLAKMLNDEQSFIDEPFSTIARFLPNITIKFLL
ncbi:MAG: hypothetical protein A4E52_00601 [Pelotomaculum sp. PtaB.Bin013]|uniref:Uncharacterized protein n=1 Tax=Pelotomaculum isophthalicicum JI TaxID=947010 RepID=A0A9X4H3Y8_9FIRM|nr:hypothetical protein [Pelotomaculum isophthalicicum]MDF9409945.1 hypothetical protein [Pelotomaculum isophthalicicum JI]OPX91116.1 MAG: hypothetical protein A4E52_00601 [Pelotomaculum sp. PtaB.Bin013]